MTDPTKNHPLIASQVSAYQEECHREVADGTLNTKPERTRIVFVHDDFNLGGVGTLEHKLFEELLRQKFSVVMACREKSHILLTSGSYDLFIHDGYPDLIRRASELVNKDTSRIIFVSFQPSSAMAALVLEGEIYRKLDAKIEVAQFHWVCHSRAFFFSRYKLANMVSRKTFSLLPRLSTYFMNDAALAAHQAHWRTDLSEYPVLRIAGREPNASKDPVDRLPAEVSNAASSTLRIVSVGRLVSFKSYNLHAATVVRQLRQAGITITWDIWGYGPDEADILQSIKDNEVSDVVRLRGTLAHEGFDETVASYDLFVGMGTAVLEAAKTRTPVIVAVENRRDACFGHLHQSPADSVGDQVYGSPEKSLRESIRSFASLDHHHRTQIGILDSSAARERESTLCEFANAIISARKPRPKSFTDMMFLRFAKLYLLIQLWKRTVRMSRSRASSLKVQ